MAPPGICPQCGDRLPADMPHGVCPKCMLSLGFDEPVGQPTTPAGPRGPAPAPAELAEHFPQLEILDLVGQGGMGAVYRARQRALNRLVALKVLPQAVGSDAAFAERFTREAQSLARLAHPHIVVVYDFGQVGGHFYFLMEFVDGINLRQAIQTGKLASREALSIVPQICDALQYAHDEGIVHRDIKPENILLDKRGNVKIADFGLAKLLAAGQQDYTLTGTGQVMGTPHYMAPEQIEKPASVDHRADIYSLGVVFYELLTGELPIGRFAPPSQKTGGPARLDQVVLRTLEKEPARRYQHASEVKTAVETLDEPAAQKPPADPAKAPVPDHLRRLRVPFTIGHLYAGFATASGCLGFNGQQLTLEYQVQDDIVGYVSSGWKQVAIPLAEIMTVEVHRSWLGLSLSIELSTYQLSALQEVPRSQQGRARLHVARRDAPLARRLVSTVQQALPRDIGPDQQTRPPVTRPPQTLDDAEALAVTVASIRLPAIAMLVLGILCCLTAFVTPILMTLPWGMDSRQSLRIDVPQVQVVPAEVSSPLELPEVPDTDTPLPQSLPTPTAPAADAESARADISRALSDVKWESGDAGWNRLVMLLAVCVTAVLQMAFGVVLIVAAAHMRKLEQYPLCVTASILAMLPVYPWWMIGVPIGIWSLVVVTRPESRLAFRRRRAGGATPERRQLAPGKPKGPDAYSPSTERSRSGRFVALAIALALAVSLLLGAMAALWLYGRAERHPLRPTPPQSQSVDAPVEPQPFTAPRRLN